MRQVLCLQTAPGGYAVMVMPGNDSGSIVHYWAGKYPGKIGWMISPPHEKCKLRPWMPFALDNGAFGAWKRGERFNEPAWLALLNHVRMTGLRPLWAIVPDVVADKGETIRAWGHYSPELDRRGILKAFAVQDGMTPADVPNEAAVVFVGGTTEWKWRSLPIWTSNFPRVHVGRVNAVHRLLRCEELGVESVDGTGWFRGTDGSRQAEGLKLWVEGAINRHQELNLQLA